MPDRNWKRLEGLRLRRLGRHAASVVGLYEFATACRFVKAAAGANVTGVFVHLVTQK